MNKQEIGSKIKSVRKSRGLKVKDLAKEHGIGTNQIASIERGQGAYTIDTLIRYAEIVGVEIFIVELEIEKNLPESLQ